MPKKRKRSPMRYLTDKQLIEFLYSKEWSKELKRIIKENS